ncbi:unnamed protein product, partial [Ectocarpus sp. 12 AP-2014]
QSVKSLNPLLRIALIAGVESAVKLHIHRGDDLNARDKKGMTPLMLAACRKKAGIVRLLLAAGANPALSDFKGKDALVHAKEAGCPECFLLLREGLDVIVAKNEYKISTTKHLSMGQEKEHSPLKATDFAASIRDSEEVGRPHSYLKPETAIKIERSLDAFGRVKADEKRCNVVPEERAVEDSIGPLKTQFRDPKQIFTKNETKEGLAKLRSMFPLKNNKEKKNPDELVSFEEEKFQIKAKSSAKASKFQDIDSLEYAPLDFDRDNEWEAEHEPVVPEGDGTVVEQALILHEEIGRHKAIDTDEEWDDIRLFLPSRAIPIVHYDAKHGSVSELFFVAIREGSVPLHALINACLGDDDLRNEDTEKLVSVVLGDLGALVDNDNVVNELPFLGVPTIDEEYEVSEALTFAENLASGWNTPMRFYSKGLKETLLTAEEEVELSRIMEESTAVAIKALSSWPNGLAVIFDAADQVERGEADVEMFSTGPEPSEEDELGLEKADANEGDLEPAAIYFISAISEARSAGDNFNKIYESILTAGLSRRFLIEIAEKLKNDISAEVFISAIQRQVVARKRMILSNLRLVIAIAKKFSWSQQPFDDLIQEGNIGLMKAVERYDWRRGFRFSTYATWWIRQQISRSIANNERVVRAPVHIQAAARNLLHKRDEIEAAIGYSVTEQELSIREGVSPDKIKLLLSTFDEVSSLDKVEKGKKLPVIEYFSGLEKFSPEFIAEQGSLRTALLQMLEELDVKSAQIIAMRFGLGGADPLTLEEVGLYFDVTRERIRQIESKALIKLSHPNRAEKLSA